MLNIKNLFKEINIHDKKDVYKKLKVKRPKKVFVENNIKTKYDKLNKKIINEEYSSQYFSNMFENISHPALGFEKLKNLYPELNLKFKVIYIYKVYYVVFNLFICMNNIITKYILIIRIS